MTGLSLKTLLKGGTMAAAMGLMAAPALAQTTTIDTPGSTVIVPDAALEAEPSQGFVLESDYPRFESLENYAAISEVLIAQGYSDVQILREGPILTVTAQRAGVPVVLVYSTANARLVSVNGVETRADPEDSSGTDVGPDATGANPVGSGAGVVGDPDEAAEAVEAEQDADTPDADAEADDGADAGADDGADTDGGEGEGEGEGDSEG